MRSACSGWGSDALFGSRVRGCRVPGSVQGSGFGSWFIVPGSGRRALEPRTLNRTRNPAPLNQEPTARLPNPCFRIRNSIRLKKTAALFRCRPSTGEAAVPGRSGSRRKPLQAESRKAAANLRNRYHKRLDNFTHSYHSTKRCIAIQNGGTGRTNSGARLHTEPTVVVQLFGSGSVSHARLCMQSGLGFAALRPNRQPTQ